MKILLGDDNKLKYKASNGTIYYFDFQQHDNNNNMDMILHNKSTLSAKNRLEKSFLKKVAAIISDDGTFSLAHIEFLQNKEDIIKLFTTEG
jgi:hypothetical protein